MKVWIVCDFTIWEIIITQKIEHIGVDRGIAADQTLIL